MPSPSTSPVTLLDLRTASLQNIVFYINKFPVASPTQKVQYSSDPNIAISTYPLTLNLEKENYHYINGEKIRRIKLIETKRNETIRINVEVSTTQHKFLLWVDTQDRSYFISYFLNCGPEKECGFLKTERRAAEVWKQTCAKDIYLKSNAGAHYAKLHPQFAATVNQLVLARNLIHIKLFAFGCGDGNDLKTILAKLQENKNFTVAGLGFDFNPTNFAKEPSTDSFKLLAGNTLELEKLHLEHENHAVFSALDRSRAKTIMLFCGSVTRHVLNGSCDGLMVLQQACRKSDFAFFTGYEAILFTRRMVKRCGWKCDILLLPEIGEHTVIYQLEKPTREERKTWLLKQFNKDVTFLDLSMSCDPLSDFLLLQEAKVDLRQVRCIDLNWVHIDMTHELPHLVAALAPFQCRNVTIKHNLEDERFSMELRKLTAVTIDRDHQKAVEVQPFSNRFIRQFGIQAERPFPRLESPSIRTDSKLITDMSHCSLM